MRLSDFSTAAYFSCILVLAIGSSVQGGRWSKREAHCQGSKLVVYLSNKATAVKMVADNGEILLTVDSTNTKMKDLDKLLIFTNMVFFPQEGHELPGNYSDYSIIKHPLDNGIELSIVDKMNNTVFRKKFEGSNEGLSQPDVKCAHFSGYKVVVEPGLEVNKHDGYNMTALIWATLFGQTDVAKDLVERGAEVNLAGVYGTNPMLTAISSDKADMVEYLISHGAEVNGIMGPYKASPLHVAAFKARLECTKVLLKHGANISSLDETEGATPLHFAAGEGHIKVVKELVARGADVNARTKNGDTPLHAAVVFDEEEVVHFLIQSGADLNSKNKNGDTPLMAAVTRTFNEDDSLNMVKHLVEHHKPDLNAKNKDGETALSLAASKGHRKVEAYLKAHGAQ